MLGSVHTFYFTAALGGKKEQPLKVIDAPTLQMQKLRKMGFPKRMQKHFLCWRETVVLHVWSVGRLGANPSVWSVYETLNWTLEGPAIGLRLWQSPQCMSVPDSGL